MATTETQTDYEYRIINGVENFHCSRRLGDKLDACMEGALDSFEMGEMGKALEYILDKTGMSKFTALIESCLIYSLDITGRKDGSRLRIYGHGFDADLNMRDPRFYTRIREFCESVISGASIPTEPV